MSLCGVSSSSLSQPVHAAKGSRKPSAQSITESYASPTLGKFVVTHDNNGLRHFRQARQAGARAGLEKVRVNDEHGLVLQVEAGPATRSTCSTT